MSALGTVLPDTLGATCHQAKFGQLQIYKVAMQFDLGQDAAVTDFSYVPVRYSQCSLVRFGSSTKN